MNPLISETTLHRVAGLLPEAISEATGVSAATIRYRIAADRELITNFEVIHEGNFARCRICKDGTIYSTTSRNTLSYHLATTKHLQYLCRQNDISLKEVNRIMGMTTDVIEEETTQVAVPKEAEPKLEIDFDAISIDKIEIIDIREIK